MTYEMWIGATLEEGGRWIGTTGQWIGTTVEKFYMDYIVENDIGKNIRPVYASDYIVDIVKNKFNFMVAFVVVSICLAVTWRRSCRRTTLSRLSRLHREHGWGCGLCVKRRKCNGSLRQRCVSKVKLKGITFAYSTG